MSLAKTSQQLVQSLGLATENKELLVNFEAVPDLFKGDKELDKAFDSSPTEFVKSTSLHSRCVH